MTKEFGVYDPTTAKEIKRRVMGDDRVSPNDYSTAYDQKTENEYFAVVTGFTGISSSIPSNASGAASNPVDGYLEIRVRIFEYDDYSLRTLKLVEGEAGLIDVVHRFEGVGLMRGMFTTIRKFREEWKFDSIDCGPSDMLLALLEETDPAPSE
jgi:hypothetical protein